MRNDQLTINFAARPLSRRNDPASSMRAAERQVRSGKRDSDCARCLAAVELFPGSRARMIAIHTGMEPYVARKRLADLRTRKLAYSRRPEDAGELIWFHGRDPMDGE
jgi:hypothetical protein